MNKLLKEAMDGLEAIMKKRFNSRPEGALNILKYIYNQGTSFHKKLFTHLIMFYGLLDKEGEIIKRDSISNKQWVRLTKELKPKIESHIKWVLKNLGKRPETVSARLMEELARLRGMNRKAVFLAHILINNASSYVPYRMVSPQVRRIASVDEKTALSRVDAMGYVLMQINAAKTNTSIFDMPVKIYSTIMEIIDSIHDPLDRAIALEFALHDKKLESFIGKDPMACGLEKVMRKRFIRKDREMTDILKYIYSVAETEHARLFSHLVRLFGLLPEDGEIVSDGCMEENKWYAISLTLSSDAKNFVSGVLGDNLEADDIGELLKEKLASLQGIENQAAFLNLVLRQPNGIAPYMKLPDIGKKYANDESVTEKLFKRHEYIKAKAAEIKAVKDKMHIFRSNLMRNAAIMEIISGVEDILEREVLLDIAKEITVSKSDLDELMEILGGMVPDSFFSSLIERIKGLGAVEVRIM